MGKKDKKKEKKEKKKEKKKLLKSNEIEGAAKSECCEKYKKGEHKRCNNCPKFDLL